jgi:hypothetical protein
MPASCSLFACLQPFSFTVLEITRLHCLHSFISGNINGNQTFVLDSHPPFICISILPPDLPLYCLHPLYCLQGLPPSYLQPSSVFPPSCLQPSFSPASFLPPSHKLHAWAWEAGQEPPPLQHTHLSSPGYITRSLATSPPPHHNSAANPRLTFPRGGGGGTPQGRRKELGTQGRIPICLCVVS